MNIPSITVKVEEKPVKFRKGELCTYGGKPAQIVRLYGAKGALIRYEGYFSNQDFATGKVTSGKCIKTASVGVKYLSKLLEKEAAK